MAVATMAKPRAGLRIVVIAICTKSDPALWLRHDAAVNGTNFAIDDIECRQATQVILKHDGGWW